MEQASAYCAVCRRQSLITRAAPNHAVHAILTLFLCGLWAIPWLLMIANPEPWRCQACGGMGLVGVPRRDDSTGSLVLAGLIGVVALAVGVAVLVGLSR
jgi:hypothetical protein